MNNYTEIHGGHPLFRKLRNGLLWHCTSPKEFLQIREERSIKPNDGRVQKWGPGRYACQQLGGVSLFDFTTEPEKKVLESADRWQQFLGCSPPVTVILGLARNRLPGDLVPYPENKDGTTGNVIPWVEVCYRGPIPVDAIVEHLLVCSADYSQFHVGQQYDESKLAEVAAKCEAVIRSQAAQRRPMGEKVLEINRWLKQQRQQRKGGEL